MTDRNILYVTSWLPREGGGGVEQRSTNNFLGLKRLGRVHILHSSGAYLEPTPLIAENADSFTRMHAIRKAHPDLFRIALKPTLGDKILRRAWGVSGPMFELSLDEIDAIAKSLPDIRFDAIFAMHLRNAVCIDRVADKLGIPPERRVIDWDFLEASSIQNMATARTGRRGMVSRRLLAWNTRKLSRFEDRILRNWGLHLCSSHIDVPYLSRSGRTVRAMPNTCIPPAHEPAPVQSGDVPTVLFVGTLAYWPNMDGVEHFLERIWPQIRARTGNRARFLVVGRAIPQFLRRHSGKDGIEMHSDVPEVAPYYNDASVVVAPMRHGDGSAIKIVEALGHRRPLVCYSVSGERHQLEHGTHLMIAKSDEEFVQATVDLLSDHARAKKIAEAGYEYVRSYLTREAVVTRFQSEVGMYLNRSEPDRTNCRSADADMEDSTAAGSEVVGAYR